MAAFATSYTNDATRTDIVLMTMVSSTQQAKVRVELFILYDHL